MSTTNERGFAYLTREMMEHVWPLLSDDQRAMVPVLKTYHPRIEPSYSTLAKRLGKHRRSIIRTMAGLEAVGLLVREHQPARRTRGTNCFRLADVTQPDVLAAVVARLTGDTGVTSDAHVTSDADVTSDTDVTRLVTPVSTTSDTDVTQRRELKKRSERREGAAVAADVPAARLSPDRSTPSASKRTREAVDDQLLNTIASDPTLAALAGYYLFGREAVGKAPAQWAGLKPSATNWAPRSGNYSRPEPECSVPALAAFVWVRTAYAREKTGAKIGLPALGKLVGTVKALRKRMTQDDLVAHIDRIAANWPAITAALSWMATPPALDELLLTNRHVIEQSNRIASGQPLSSPRPNGNPVCGMTASAAADFGKQLKARAGRIRL